MSSTEGFRSFNWMRGVAKDLGISKMHRFILISLLCLYRFKDGRCNPGYDNLAGELGVNRSTVFRAVAVGIKRGWLAKPTGGGGSGICSNFVFTFPTSKGGAGAPLSSAPNRRPPATVSSAPNRRTSATVSNSNRRTSATGTVAPVHKNRRRAVLEVTDVAGDFPPNGHYTGKGAGEEHSHPPNLDRKKIPKKGQQSGATKTLIKKAPAGANGSAIDAAAFNQVHPRPGAIEAVEREFASALKRASADHILEGARRYAARRAIEISNGDLKKWDFGAVRWLSESKWTDEFDDNIIDQHGNPVGVPKPPIRRGGNRSAVAIGDQLIADGFHFIGEKDQ